MPGIEVISAYHIIFQQLIFFYVNFDKCRKQIIKFEEKRNTASAAISQHPKNYKKEALDLLRCHSKK